MAQNIPAPEQREPQRRQTEATTVDARNNFADVLNRAAYGKEHVILTRRGKKVAALIPVEDLPGFDTAAATALLELDENDAS